MMHLLTLWQTTVAVQVLVPYDKGSSSENVHICEGDTIPGYVAATKEIVNINVLEQVISNLPAWIVIIYM